MTAHRGLSAVVGTVFLIAVVMGALSYVTYSLDVMGNFSESLIAEESRQKDKQSEAFQIESIDVTGANKLDGVIKNTGQIPVKLTTLWIDEQDVNDVVQKFTLNKEIAPGDSVDLSSLVDFDMDPTKGYNMKVVSSRGAVNSFYVNSLANENVYMKLTATPTIIPSTFTSTLLFTVVNNMSNGNYLYNLTPVLNDTKQSLGETSTGLAYDLITGPTPSTYDSLGPGEVAVFTYNVELTGTTDNDSQLFNVTLANANPGNEALATVAIKAVPLATDAGSALTSFGLTQSTGQLTDVFYFHSDTSLTPNSEFPMDGASPNSAGVTKSPNGNTLEFISPGMFASTHLPAGTFNIPLTYFSSPVPLNLPEPSFMFMMDEKDSGDHGEIADMINLFDPDKGFKEGGGKPTFGVSEDPNPAHTSGPNLARGHDSGFFHFDAGDYFYDDWNVDGASEKFYTEPQTYDTTTALWVRIEPTNFTYKGIMTWGCAPGGSCFGEDTMYIAVVTGGEIEFGYDDDDQPSPIDVVCKSSAEYDDDLWHHVVVVRDGGYCELWVDNVRVATSGTVGGIGSGDIDVDRINIGRDSNEEDFDGDIASIIHWNQNALSSAQIEDLYYTNYGNNGTRLYFSVDHVDADGLTVLNNIVPQTKVEIPFWDPSRGNTNNEGNPWVGLHTSNTTDKKYGLFNMTGTSSSAYTLGIGEMLKVTLDWAPWGDEHNLPINIMFDDSSGWTLPSGPTYLQTPTPNPRWPTYLSFDFEEQVKYLAYNEGPGGIWFVYSGTRLVLTTNDGVSSYAAVPHYVNKTTQPNPSDTYALISAEQDSIYIPDSFFAEIDFYQLQSPPAPNNNPPSTTEVPTGSYDAALYLQGYDEKGETFKKTINLGLIRITGNP